MLLALKIFARVFVGEAEPARGVNIGWLKNRVDFVFGLQALGDDFKLQGSDRAKQQRAGS